MEGYATPAQKAKLVSLGVPVPEGLSKQDASGLIDAALKGQMPQTPTPASQYKKPYSSYSKPAFKKSDTNFYVSYAKDLVIAMFEHNFDKIKGLTLDEVMEAAIIAIDNAKKHFDNGN